METINKITTSKQTTMYDHLYKMIIGNEEVLSRIIKVVVDEAKYLSFEEIRRLIKGVHIGDRMVNPHFHLRKALSKMKAWFIMIFCVILMCHKKMERIYGSI